jgi:hypothetical protein
MSNGRRQPSCGGTSRMTRECQVRFCERLGVQFPGPTRQQRSSNDVCVTSAITPTAAGKRTFRHFAVGRVEDGRGSLGHSAAPRFPSPLIEPDVPISGIRLSDWLHREAHERNHRPQASSVRRALFLRLTIELSLKNLDHSRCLQAHRQSPSPRLLRKHTRSQGPFLRRHYPASSVL